MCLAQGPHRSDVGEARTRDPSVSSQALYHWATALPKSLQIRWPTPTPSIYHMLLLGASKKTYWCLGYNATVLDADSRVWMFTMHGRIQKILSRGWVSWKLYFSFFTEGSYFFSRLSITVFLRKHITTCDLPGGMQTRCPPTLGTRTCDA